ncbi:DUF6070 family protein [Lachnoclostridium sp. An181]|uniref:DUF6070 family protein n=1 Tax=Lachnoclostridium sp. An181 TaxID=1965575 RepID=UPI000B3AB9EB|nr:DUF6070 family protein [Lachnoclostridium sp. An181]OUP49290.1 hypothetical protein B5F18_08610 [Lachnoclostridium sp. An181]
MKMKKLLCMVLASVCLIGCASTKEKEEVSTNGQGQSQEKGYDLPVDEKEKKQGEQDLKKIIESGGQDPGKLLETATKSGAPGILAGVAANMVNYEKADEFLKNAKSTQKGEIQIYQIKDDGRVIRNQFTFDGEEMFLLYMSARKEDNGQIVFGETSYTKVEQWRYTDKGWFAYELCAPEWPKVTEVVESTSMIQIRPVDERYLKIENQYLRPVGYKGNNLFLAQWQQKDMDNLDYIGIFDTFYQMIYKTSVDNEKFQNGVPAKEFESVIQRFLSVSTEELRKSRYYRGDGTYLWQAYGVGNHVGNEVTGAIPKIVDMRENEDGTYTLAIESVNETSGEDCVFSHELTVRFLEDGGIIYVSNHLTGWGKYTEPGYQYRVGE